MYFARFSIYTEEAPVATSRAVETYRVVGIGRVRVYEEGESGGLKECFAQSKKPFVVVVQQKSTGCQKVYPAHHEEYVLGTRMWVAPDGTTSYLSADGRMSYPPEKT